MLQGKTVQLPHQPLEGQHITVQVARKHDDTVYDLRNQCDHQDHNEQDHREEGEDDRKGMPQFHLFNSVKDIFAENVFQGIQNIGDHEGHDDRREDMPYGSQKLKDPAEVRQQHVQHDRRAKGNGIGKPFFFQKIFVEFHLYRSLTS